MSETFLTAKIGGSMKVLQKILKISKNFKIFETVNEEGSNFI